MATDNEVVDEILEQLEIRVQRGTTDIYVTEVKQMLLEYLQLARVDERETVLNALNPYLRRIVEAKLDE